MAVDKRQSAGAARVRTALARLGGFLPLLAALLVSAAQAQDIPATWTRAGVPTPQALAMTSALRTADSFGLRPQDYAEGWSVSPAAMGTALASSAAARFDLALSAAAAHFLKDLHFGRVDPRAAGFDLRTPRAPLEIPTLLQLLKTTDNLDKVIASVEPHFLHYQLLKHALARYRMLASGAAAATIEEQRQTPYAKRVRQIELTLERWRWIPAFDTPPIIVNIPQFRLFAFHSTQDRRDEILQMDVIVGKIYPRTQTPVFVADMKYVVFRPYWDVPFSITQREMLPAIRANPDYLRKERLELVQGQGDSAPVVPVSADSIALLASGKLRLRQRPGADNALGLIKFILPNAYNVYLHSTPAHNLFRQSRRAFSHGCIRVSDPVALANFVLADSQRPWTAASIEAAMQGRDNMRVNLIRPIRVLILYGTALATEDGKTLFFNDIYGHDLRLERLLRLPPVATH